MTAHELWHTLERLVSERERAALRARFPAAPRIDAQGAGASLSHEERVAHAFGAWAAARIGGKSITVDAAAALAQVKAK